MSPTFRPCVACWGNGLFLFGVACFLLFQGAKCVNVKDVNLRIVGGHNATPGRFPYFAIVSIHLSFVDVRICGGALIAPDVILTASHCWQGPKSALAVQVGIFDVHDATVHHDVLHYLPHPLFGVDRFFDKDIMLLILNETSSNTVIKLNRDGKVPGNGQSLLTIGLGATNDTLDGPFPTVLQDLELQSISNSECERATDGNFTYRGLLTENMVCGLHPDAGPCYEDSGGPLIVQGDDASRDVLVGTVSWDNGCVSSVFPNVYTRVSGMMDWIDANVCRYSKSPPADFKCQEKTASPAPTPATSNNERSIPVTVQFVFVNTASYTWWFILKDDGELVFIHPRYSYASNVTQDQQVIMLPVGHTYTFVVKNEAYNNLGRLARFAVRTGSHGNGQVLVYSLGGSFDLETRINFTISDSLTVAPASSVVADTFPPSESPTIHPTMTPTTTNRPTGPEPSRTPVSAAPTIQTQDITIVINFNGYPSEIAFKILDSGDRTMLSVPFGTFGVSDLTINKVARLPTKQSYTFVIMDFFGDGFWPGDFSLWLGPPTSKGRKLYSGAGIRGFEERHGFFVPSRIDALSSSTSQKRIWRRRT